MGDLVFIDIETTGLDWGLSRAIEIAYVTQEMTEPKVIIPFRYDPKENYTIWKNADPKAMEINRFYGRYPEGVDGSSDEEVAEFLATVTGATIVGANVRFDAHHIRQTLGLKDEPWHYRLWDTTAYSAGVFGLSSLEGWKDISRRIKDQSLLHRSCSSFLNGATPPPLLTTMPDHSAAADCQSVKECFNWMQWYIKHTDRKVN